MKRWEIPLRVGSGGFILASGILHRRIPDEEINELHDLASTVYPLLSPMKPHTFVRLLRAGELGLGTAVLLPVVPAHLAGASLAAFSGGLMLLYLKAPGMRREGTLFPTKEGMAYAKDGWLFSMALALLVGGWRERRTD